MTQDEIIQMAFDAGFDWSGEELTWEGVICTEELMAFAKQIERRILSMDNPHLRIALDAAQDKARKDEREACAKVCEDNANDLSEGDWDSACINCADNIRARGEA